MQKITTELKINTGSMLEFIVLKMLSGETHSIGEILEELKVAGLKIPTGTLYPLLAKLHRENYVITGYEDGDTKIVIKTYSLTEKGRQRLTDLKGDWKRLNSLVASLGSR